MIYLDHASATPLSKAAFRAMTPYFSELFFNPSSAYLPAQQVRADYESAKSTIAHCIGAKSPHLIITSGATEANNLAFSILNSLRLSIHKSSSPSCLYLATEHDSIVNVAKNYPHQEIKVDSTGLIDLVHLKSQLTEQVALISVALANNEIGTIQPLAEITEIVRLERQRRLKHHITTPLYLHSDASSAQGLININIARLGVDLLTLNSAKIFGPKGVGALYVSPEVELTPAIFGGGQERSLRSGTENVPGVIGFATAFKEAKAHLNSNRQKYSALTTLLQQELTNHSIIPHFLGNVKHKLANFCALTYPGLDAERLIYKLEDHQVYLSTGSACSARKGEKSRTLVAIGLSDAEIAGSLRLTLGPANTKSDIIRAANLIKQVVTEETNRHA